MSEPTEKDTEIEVAERVAVAVAKKRTRVVRPFPACPFEEALGFAAEIQKFGSGQPVRRLSLFDHLGKSPESGPSRQAVINAGKYGLIEGGIAAEHLKLTPEGAKAVDDELPQRDRIRAQVKLAIQIIPPFSALYERFKGNKLPAKTALVDSAIESGVEANTAEEAVDTLILNLRYVGLLQMLSGAERIVSLEHLFDSLPSTELRAKVSSDGLSAIPDSRSTYLITTEQAQFETVCFYVTPIGEEGSELRRHSDLFLSSIVEPALEQFRLKVIRADQIDKPGTITRQIIEYLLKARLVIADMSYHNPNVFYELAIRHAARLPVVQVVRAADRVPFDLSQSRTIKIDTTDIYSLVPRLEIYKSEIASQVRRALEDPDAVDNPISIFYPSFKVVIDAQRGG